MKPEEYENDPNETREDYIKRMEAEGYRVVYPASNDLQIDIDTNEQYETFKAQIDILEREFPHTKFSVSPSRNGLPGRHITIKMFFEMNDTERIAWQAAMGSDPVRELLSLIRLRRGDNHPTIFVEKITEREGK